ncbi:guanine nucleotide-binding protein subunit gamma 2-like isoform X2 [Diospyros lotus]|uniref:guanine nucleotide-binding protein subunit gamma 2-like isoform X2 n=1 Tax=Diospyros lotus TaxID=55363 RepID=UPI0022518D1D|nr:guanine nucleotide-binding protein subunit gamma 2-like isoform X2 [Diospyros lotus]
MQSESADHQGSEQARSAAAADTRGKHRISAELKRLEQEARFLEEELEELEKMEATSAGCKDTSGPTNPSWDRWFEGPQESQGCRCSIL